MRLSNDNVRWIPYEPQYHAGHVYRWFHSGDYEWFFGNIAPLTTSDASKIQNAFVMVDANKPDDVMGITLMTDIRERHRNLQIHSLVDKKYQSKGLFYGAFIMFCNYILNSMNFYKIIITSAEKNIPAIGILNKAGFTGEGEFKNEIYVDGEFHNVKRYAITKGAFNKLHKAGLSAPKSEEV